MAVVAPRQRQRRSSDNPVSLGRFTGGLNTLGERNTIAENEVVELFNLEVDLDGSLVTRPPIASDNGTYAGVEHLLLGYVVYGGSTYLVAAFPAADVTRMMNLGSGAWTQVCGFAATSFSQYNNNLVFCRPGATGGGRYDLGSAAQTSIASMPAMRKIVFYLGRFYGVSDAGFLYYSKLDIPGTSTVYDWDAAVNVVAIAAGDGQNATGLIADPAGLVILKQSSTYRFTYAATPAAGVLVQLSPTIGADNSLAYVAAETVTVTFCNGALYQLLNGKYTALSRRKIKFAGTTLAGLTQRYGIVVSLFADRILVWHYGTIYAYSLLTATWSTWYSDAAHPAMFAQAPAQFTGSGVRRAYAVTGVTDVTRNKLWRVDAGAGLVEPGGYQWRVTTRLYDFGAPFEYKRLMYWDLSLKTAKLVRALVYPADVPQGVATWDQMATMTWDVLALGNWDNPLFLQQSFEDDVVYASPSPIPIKMKMRAAFKFLSAFFQVGGDVTGAFTDSPARLYSITPMLRTTTTTYNKVS